MLPFRAPGFQQFAVGQPNLFGQQVLLPSMPIIVSTANNVILPNSVQFQSPQPPPQQPPPMIIGPGVMGDMENSKEQSSSIANATDDPSQWSEHLANDGRTYYYNKITQTSSWSKPDALKTPQEREKTIWREYKTVEGRAYYYNIETNLTTWTKPTILDSNGTETKKEESDKVAASSLTLTDTSDLERAMAATLKRLDKKAENGASTKASTSETAAAINGTNKSVKNKPGKVEKVVAVAETTTDAQDSLKKRQADKFRELIRDKYQEFRVNTSMSWEQAVKHLQHDPRYGILQKISEKKQIFIAWKNQRYKEERDEKRLAIKKAKEDLEKWLLANPKMRPSLRYSKADFLFGSEEAWAVVSEIERREIFADVSDQIKKREDKKRTELRERNIKVLADILNGIEEINHKTTWAQTQRVLIENPDFASDHVLQGMDKEDALIVFQDHIRLAEELYSKEKQLEEKRQRRHERKVREAFMDFLKELHSKGIIMSISTWSALYPTISADSRFEMMLNQGGSTALDLFKFYVEELKNQYYEDRRIIKEILKDANLTVTCTTSFDQIQQAVRNDSRGKNVDSGNMKLCYNSLFDKAQNKEKETEREQQRKLKRQESAFRSLLRTILPAIEPTTKWEEIVDKISHEEVYLALENDQIRKGFFDNYIKSISEACGHQHGSLNAGTSKRKKKDKKKKKKREDYSDSETEIKPKKSKKHHDGETSERKKKKSKHRTPEHNTVYESPSDEGEILDKTESSFAVTEEVSDD